MNKYQNNSCSTPNLAANQRLEHLMGADVLAAFNNKKTVELMVNADGRVWLELLGEPMRCIGELAAARVQAIIETISGFHEKETKRSSPLLEAEFHLDGSRFAGQLPPVVTAPTFSIRKRASAVFTLIEYVEKGVMTANQRQTIVEAVTEHRNILIIGGTGSGKTTLVNAVIAEIVQRCPEERIFIIEDTGEIQCSAENFVQYHTTIDVDMSQLLKTTLRMRPDRILVGEVRGAEALDLLDAWNTGHEGGAATLHANSALAGLTRLKSLVTRNPSAPKDIETLIGEVVHLIVHISRTPTGRTIKEVLKVSGFNGERYLTKSIH